MHKIIFTKLVAIFAIMIVLHVHGSGVYLCLFGPDNKGSYEEEVVNETVAKNCGKFCICNEVQPKCLFGPD